MTSQQLPGTRETLGATLLGFTPVAVIGGLAGSDTTVLVAAVAMALSGLLLARGRPRTTR